MKFENMMKARSKKPHVTGFHLYEIFRINKTIGVVNRLAVARTGSLRERGAATSWGYKFHFCDDESVPKPGQGDGCTIMNISNCQGTVRYTMVKIVKSIMCMLPQPFKNTNTYNSEKKLFK